MTPPDSFLDRPESDVAVRASRRFRLLIYHLPCDSRLTATSFGASIPKRTLSPRISITMMVMFSPMMIRSSFFLLKHNITNPFLGGQKTAKTVAGFEPTQVWDHTGLAPWLTLHRRVKVVNFAAHKIGHFEQTVSRRRDVARFIP